jgi:hypothetical protein
MILGFTGTRKGMTAAQKKTVSRMLDKLRPQIVIHGCCHGADQEFHSLAVWHCVDVIRGYPGPAQCQKEFARTKCNGKRYVVSKSFLERNRDIVDDSEKLLACPGKMEEEQRSGTWATIRYARKTGKPRTIVWPDGTVEEEGDL